jgi:hypothetical protein
MNGEIRANVNTVKKKKLEYHERQQLADQMSYCLSGAFQIAKSI